MKPIDILLVEDNPGDVRLTMEAFEDSKIVNEVNVATDGGEALDFLFKKGEFKQAHTPDLILLDLNLPGISGFEVLKTIKDDENLKLIPVVVLTNSQSDRDILQSYNLHANCYVSKPVSYSAFLEVVKSIELFWFTIVKLPES
jgi:two-component system, chemotaxis family, response regulator Rcp1